MRSATKRYREYMADAARVRERQAETIRAFRESAEYWRQLSRRMANRACKAEAEVERLRGLLDESRADGNR